MVVTIRKEQKMKRKLKVLGLTLTAALALSGLAASGASAVEFTAASYPTHVVATDEFNDDVFHIGGATTLECDNESFTATLTAKSKTISFTPSWVDCRTAGVPFYDVTVTHNGCNLVFHTTPNNVSITCPTGKVIEIHHYNNSAHTSLRCTDTVGAQQPVLLEGPTYTNKHPGVTVSGKAEVTLQTHGECSFGFTINQQASYTYTVVANPTTGGTIDVG
jgi:hypothetical protein